jgi:hypothetical protein
MVAYSKMQYLLAGVGRRYGRPRGEIRRTLAELLPCEHLMSDHAIDTAERRDVERGDAARRKRRVDVGSLTLPELTAALKALSENSVRYTVSGADTLQARIMATSGRTIPQSTIDDAVRAHDRTPKVAEYFHPDRDPVASAQVRQDVGSYPLRCVVNIDATHVEAADYIRRQGRAAKGKKARLCANAIKPGGYSGLRTLYAAMNIYGMVDGACKVIDGAIDNEVFLDWALINLLPALRRYDRLRPVPNSVLLLDNAVFHHQHEFLDKLEEKGVRVIFLTPYDPKCAPIERANHQVRTPRTQCAPCDRPRWRQR